MKRVFVCIALVTLSIGAIAQTKAVRIESPIVSEKDFVWYTEQKEAWKALTQKDPTNETAWLNYYNAARYMSWFQQEDSTAKQVVHEMEQIIPNSYTFNFCAYRESVQARAMATTRNMPRQHWQSYPMRCNSSTTTTGCAIWRCRATRYA